MSSSPRPRPEDRGRRGSLFRYAFAWGYLICFVLIDLVFASLSPHGQAAFTAWASTNVANLSREPVGPLIVSALIGSLVSEGIEGFRVHAGQLPAADRYITDVGPSYVVVSAIVIAVICGNWLARVLAGLDFAILVFGGHIFSGLSQLDVSAVGHLAAMLTAAAFIALDYARRRRSAHVADEGADEVGDTGGGGSQYQLS